MSDFVHLNVRSDYSRLDSTIRICDLVSAARDLEMPAVGLCDHGNLFGTVEFYQEAKKNGQGVKPIIGCTLWLTHGCRHDRTEESDSSLFHLHLLARNNLGFANLCQLVNKSYLQGWHHYPRVDRELLQQHSVGLIALPAFNTGDVSWYLHNENTKAAQQTALWYREVFGNDNVYLELQCHKSSSPPQRRLIKALVNLSKVTGIPLVATNCTRYLRREGAASHNTSITYRAQEISTRIKKQSVLLGHKTNGSLLENLQLATDEMYFKSAEEMKHIFKDIVPAAVSNTVEIANKCTVNLDLESPRLPSFPLPEGVTGSELLEKRCRDGIFKRYPPEQIVEAEKRLNSELNAIREKGFEDYFLVLSDVVNYARDHGIPVGPGRGTTASSIINYALAVTDIDPLRYGLFFELFFNPKSRKPSSIGIDFCPWRQEEVLHYIQDTYGNNFFAQISASRKMHARAVVQEAHRVLKINRDESEELTQLIPSEAGINLQYTLDLINELMLQETSGSEVKMLLEHAEVHKDIMMGRSRHISAVVIADGNLTECAPLPKSAEGKIHVLQYDQKSIEKQGLPAIYFNALPGLTIIEKTVNLVQEVKNTSVNINNLQLDDEKTYQLFREGNTQGIIHMESPDVRDFLKLQKPDRFEDLIAILALYRPNPLQSGMADDYLQRKHGKSKIKYLHKILEPILAETYGLILYDEQVMVILTEAGRFSRAEAVENLRTVLRKRISWLVDEMKEKFVAGASRQGISQKHAEDIFEFVESVARLAGYKSHAAAHALIIYQMGYLKANHPEEFNKALLSCSK